MHYISFVVVFSYDFIYDYHKFIKWLLYFIYNSYVYIHNWNGNYILLSLALFQITLQSNIETGRYGDFLLSLLHKMGIIIFLIVRLS